KIEAELKDLAGLWEALLPKAKLPLAYELEVEYPDGKTYTVRDPYAFLPTLGDLDLHLAMEGRHEQLYEKLGAHRREIDGVTGGASRCRSTRCTSAPGGAIRSRRTGRSRTPSSPRSSPTTSPISASRTSSCCR